MKRKYVWIYSAYAVAAAVVGLCFLVNRWMAARRQAMAPEDLSAEYAAWGIDAAGQKEFVALPPHVPYDMNAAAIGRDLFQYRKIGPGARACGICHPLNDGGADGRLHGGVFTRPAKNAVFGKFYLHDGSVSNFPALVRRMIEDGRFIGAGTLSNAMVRLGADGRIRKRFEACYGAGGFAGTNLVDAVVQYARTLMTANGPFDRFCGGRDALSPERLKGFEQFRARRCARCHSGPSLGTRVITPEGVRVPSLRGLAKRRVYQANGRLYTDLAAAVAMMPDSDFDADEEGHLSLLAFLRCL